MDDGGYGDDFGGGKKDQGIWIGYEYSQREIRYKGEKLR